MRAKVFKFCIHLESGQVYCGKENQDAEIYFGLLFPCLLFSIFHSNVIYREICVKDFSGTTAPRILKFGTNVGYDWLHCVRENQPPESGQVYCGTENQDPEIYFYLLFPCLLFSISHSNVIPRILKFGAKCWVWLVVLCKRESACCCLSFPLFVNFSFSPIKHFVTEFSAPITARVFKFWIHLERGYVYCGKENQDSMIKFCLLFPFFFHLSLQCNT